MIYISGFSSKTKCHIIHPYLPSTNQLLPQSDDLPPQGFMPVVDDSDNENEVMENGNLEDENYEEREALPKTFIRTKFNDLVGYLDLS